MASKQGRIGFEVVIGWIGAHKDSYIVWLCHSTVWLSVQQLKCQTRPFVSSTCPMRQKSSGVQLQHSSDAGSGSQFGGKGELRTANQFLRGYQCDHADYLALYEWIDSVNALYSMFGNHWLYRIENLFFDAYFPTLVYKFGIKLL